MTGHGDSEYGNDGSCTGHDTFIFIIIVDEEGDLLQNGAKMDISM